MFVFEKGLDSARMDDKKVSMDFSMKIDKVDDAYMVHIPSFNIHFYTKNEEDIGRSAHESLVSFFKYWLTQHGIDKLHSHMLSLGFSIKSIPEKLAEGSKRADRNGLTFIKNDEFVIA